MRKTNVEKYARVGIERPGNIARDCARCYSVMMDEMRCRRCTIVWSFTCMLRCDVDAMVVMCFGIQCSARGPSEAFMN